MTERSAHADLVAAIHADPDDMALRQEHAGFSSAARLPNSSPDDSPGL
jgi:hypothetical protein